MKLYPLLFTSAFAAALVFQTWRGHEIGNLPIMILWFLIVLTIGLFLDASDHRGVQKEKR